MAEIRYRMTVAYDGTNYCGWQAQSHCRTVQGEIERVLERITGAPVRVESSGRTDSGVHARAQVAHFDLPRPIPDLRRFRHSLNSLLDDDIRVYSVRRAPPGFHARFSAVGKEYRYFIYNGALVPPHLRLYHLRVLPRLDLDRMRAAAALLEGEHDFAAFAANRGYPFESTVRTVHHIALRRHGAVVTIAVRGSGFLYKMVRSIAGFLIDVGIGRLEPELAREILASGRRTAVVQTVAPHGLFLWRVFYEQSKAR